MWATRLLAPAHDQLRCDLAVWRAATGISASDRHPTGGPQLAAAAARYQGDLDRRAKSVLGDPAPGRRRLGAAGQPHRRPRITADDYWPELADRLAAIDRAGIDVRGMLSAVAAEHSLPDEQPAAALWWRLSRHLSPAATAATAGSGASTLRPAWTPVLVERLGADRARRVTGRPAWPALVAAVNAAPRDEWTPERLLSHRGRPHPRRRYRTGAEVPTPSSRPRSCGGSRCSPTPHRWTTRPHHSTPPTPNSHRRRTCTCCPGRSTSTIRRRPPTAAQQHSTRMTSRRPIRWTRRTPAGTTSRSTPQRRPTWSWTGPCTPPQSLRGPLEPTEAELWAGVDEQLKWRDAAVPKARLIELNQQAADYYSRNYPRSWAATYLRARLGTDLIGDDRFTPGYAPASWTSLTNHLRRHGATDAGDPRRRARPGSPPPGGSSTNSATASMFPIHGPDGHIHGFIGRRNPAHDSDDGTAAKAGPKYLNTPETDLFDKGAQLFGLHEGRAALAAGATPVLVEGPLDAIAVTLGADGTHIGAAPLGTAFTDKQANQLLPYIGPGRPGVLVATDADNAGWKAAATRLLATHRPRRQPRPRPHARRIDPAQILEHRGPAAIRQLLADHQPLARTLIDDRLSAEGDRLHTHDRARPRDPRRRRSHRRTAPRALDRPHHLRHRPPQRRRPAPCTWQSSTPDTPGPTTHAAWHSRGSAPSATPPNPERSNPAAHGRALAAYRSQPPSMRQEPADRWADLVARISPALIETAEWPNLAHAIDRAHAAATTSPSSFPAWPPKSRCHRNVQRATCSTGSSTPSPPPRRAHTDHRPGRPDSTDDAARRKLAEHPDDPSNATETRTEDADSAEQQRPEDRWRTLIGTIHADILSEDGWSALAETLDTAAAHGLNVEQELPRIAAAVGPLPARNAAAELRYRVLAETDPTPARPCHCPPTPQPSIKTGGDSRPRRRTPRTPPAQPRRAGKRLATRGIEPQTLVGRPDAPARAPMRPAGVRARVGRG